MIISSINGRLRYRAVWLKQASVQHAFKDELQQQGAITQITANEKTGSILVNYDANNISREKFEAFIIEIALKLVAKTDTVANPKHSQRVVNNTALNEGRRQTRKPKKWSRKQVAGISGNQAIKFGMLGTLIPSMVWAAVGSKKIHIVSGAAFLVFVAMHAYSYRERLLK